MSLNNISQTNSDMHLHGLPIAVKDYNNASGVNTIYGSPLFRSCSYQLDETIAILEQNGATPSVKQASKLNFEGAMLFSIE